MDKKIKAVFFDIDGTLYNHSIHDASASTKEALNLLHKSGIKVGIATSRCRYEMLNTSSFFKMFPFDGYIFDGGALVLEHEEILVAHTMEHSDVKNIISFAEKNKLTVRYSTYDGDYFAYNAINKDRDLFFNLYLNTPIVKKYTDDKVLNLLIYTDSQIKKNEIAKMIPNISIVNHGNVLEINSGHVDKSIGVHTIATKWGIQLDEIMCFGDGANDVNFLKSAGIGIAMGNGCEEVKEVADFVTKHISDEGISYALREYNII